MPELAIIELAIEPAFRWHATLDVRLMMLAWPEPWPQLSPLMPYAIAAIVGYAIAGHWLALSWLAGWLYWLIFSCLIISHCSGRQAAARYLSATERWYAELTASQPFSFSTLLIHYIIFISLILPFQLRWLSFTSYFLLHYLFSIFISIATIIYFSSFQ